MYFPMIHKYLPKNKYTFIYMIPIILNNFLFNLNRKKETHEALKGASGYIRHLLHDRVDIRHIPELTFVYDESIEYGKKIEEIIEDIHEENN